MGAFSYRALNAEGKVVKGTIEGDSERQVRAQLRTQKLKPISVNSTRAKPSTSNTSTNAKTAKTSKITEKKTFSFASFSGGTKFSVRDLTLFTRQLASMIQSGMTVDESLQSVAKQSRKDKVKQVVLQVRSRVLEGLELGQAMAEHPRAFNDMYRAMVRAGEKSGFLGPVLTRLAEYTETSQHTQQKVKAALVYPCVLLLATISIVAFLMVKIVPQMSQVFERADQKLPVTTQMVIGISNFLQHYWYVLFAAIGLLIVGWIRWLTIPANRLRWHRALLKLPIVKHVVIEANTSRFAATLGLLLDSGVPLLEGLTISSQVMSNDVLKKHSQEVTTQVKEGGSLHRALDQQVVFPPLLVQMAASGERNGTLSEQLQYAAKNQERELEMQISTALSILEPVTILIMAGMVGFIMYAILTPIFSMSNLV